MSIEQFENAFTDRLHGLICELKIKQKAFSKIVNSCEENRIKNISAGKGAAYGHAAELLQNILNDFEK